MEMTCEFGIFKEIKKLDNLVGTTPLIRSIKDIKLCEFLDGNCGNIQRVPNWLREVSCTDGINIRISSTNKSFA